VSRGQYIPVVDYQVSRGSPAREQVLDFLAATYTTLRESISSAALHKVRETEVGQPDQISYIYYGQEQLWWIITLYNGLVDPISELTVGRVLHIPDLSEVNRLLTKSSAAAARVSATVI